MSQMNIRFNKVDVSTSYSRRFRATDVDVRYTVDHNMADVTDILSVEYEMNVFFQNMIQDALREASGYNQNDLVSVTINSERLKEAIYMGYRKISNFNSNGFLSAISKVTQSAHEDFLKDGTLDISLRLAKNIQGGLNPTAPAQVRSRQKRSVIEVKNNDHSCFFRSLAISILYNSESNPQERNRICRNQFLIGCKALDLASRCEHQLNRPVSYSDFPSIQEKLLPEYRLLVFKGVDKKEVLYSGNETGRTPVYIEFLDTTDSRAIGHFNAVVNPTGYVEGEWCLLCLKRFTRGKHNCPRKCGQCSKPGQCESVFGGAIVDCADCNYKFNSMECYDHHFITGACAKRKKCRLCLRRYDPKKPHKCEEYYCTTCYQDYSVQPHRCYLTKPNEDVQQAEDNRHRTFTFFDIESRQEQFVNGKYFHEPNLLVSSTTCAKCYDAEHLTAIENPECDCAGKQVFAGDDCVKDFVNHLIDDILPKCDPETLQGSRTEDPYYAFVFAHNLKGYDGSFILRALMDKEVNNIQIVATGRKIMKIQIGKYLRIYDTLLFFQQPLSALPKAFGFEASKGDFPHHFNKRENENYIGPMPPLEAYRPHNLKLAAKIKLIEWYNTQQGKIFNFKEELLKYCTNDVMILQKAFMSFWFTVKNETNVDAVTRRFTLASLGLEIFKRLVLQQGDGVAITPTGGYWTGNRSIPENVWISIKEQDYPDMVRQYRIGNFTVDGCSPSTRKVFEFYGCYYHGCKRHTNYSVDKHKRTLDREAIIRACGYEIESMWECDYHRMREEDITDYSHLDLAFKYLKVHEGVDMKQALKGGRTNNLRFFYECDEEIEEIRYRDVTSLYPDVQKNCKLPIGHPSKIINHSFDETLYAYQGLIKAIILPPQNLHIPVLPLEVRGKQMYPLCRTCAEQSVQRQCTHSEPERALISTWTTMEFYKAMERGYKVIRMIQVWHYDNLRNDLFGEYIKIWLKLKTQASGWPPGVNTLEEKKQYIEDFARREGVLLNFEDMEANPALRQIAKLFLNTLWGKFAQQRNLPQTEIVTDYGRYMQIINDPTVEVTSELMYDENNMYLTFKKLDDLDAYQSVQNLVIAAFVTSYARLKLLDIIEKIEHIRFGSVLYFDTDSVIYVYQKGDPDPIPLGNFLGELTDELGGCKGTKFVSLGPKSYGYEKKNESGHRETIYKLKGIHADAGALEVINFATMVNMIQQHELGLESTLSIPQTEIRAGKDFRIYTRYLTKTLKVTSSKRALGINGITKPYGYIY